MTEPNPRHKKPVRYMDFVSRKPKANSDPLASRPVSRPVKKPAPVKKVSSVADQIPPKGAHHEEKKAPEIPVKKSEAKPYISREPAKSRDLYAEEKPESNSTEKKPSRAKEPYPSKKSPFLPNYTVDKRPLSNSIPPKKKDNFEKLSYLGVPEQPQDEHVRKKNVYDKKSEKSKDSKEKTEESKTVKVIDDSKKKHGIPVIIVILLTIILGAAVGAGVYFLLPK
ncbi:hypothetical protein IKG20_01745 [Candidatus Saccharibacteria bacterium]|nr:hypothetical protein [Candidatus Saccharibacteria bacterium]